MCINDTIYRPKLEPSLLGNLFWYQTLGGINHSFLRLLSRILRKFQPDIFDLKKCITSLQSTKNLLLEEKKSTMQPLSINKYILLLNKVFY